MKDKQDDLLIVNIAREVRKKRSLQYQDSEKNQANPAGKSISGANERNENVSQNAAFTENERNKISRRPVAGDGVSRLL